MKKKMVSLFTLIVFTVLTFSCYSTKIETIETVTSRTGDDIKILEVFTTSGTRIKFSKKIPGKIMGDKIVGVVDEDGRKKALSIMLSEVESVKFSGRQMGAKHIAPLAAGGLLILLIASIARRANRGF